MKVTYYAVVDDYSSRERPIGVIRRTEDENGQDDQQFGHDRQWSPSPLLYAWERGDGDNQLYEISEAEAEAIVERIKGA